MMFTSASTPVASSIASASAPTFKSIRINSTTSVAPSFSIFPSIFTVASVMFPIPSQARRPSSF